MSSHRISEKQLKSSLKDDEWIRKHFEELVDTYGGQYIIVAGGEVFTGKDVVRLEAKARRKHPGVMPIGMPVPRPRDFQCVL